MKNLTKGQITALKLLRARINAFDDGFRGSIEVKRALEDSHLYIESWVLPLIDFVLYGPAYRDQVKGFAHDLLASEAQRQKIHEEREAARLAYIPREEKS